MNKFIENNFSKRVIYDNSYFMKVTYKEEVIAAGRILNNKVARGETYISPCYSIDNKYFFNTESVNLNFHFSLYSPQLDSLKINFNKNKHKYLSIKPWGEGNISFKEKDNYYFLDPKIDVFRDHDIPEIDKPIIPLVKVLNSISPNIKTVQSCCGHGKSYPWVAIEFNTMEDVKYFFYNLIPSNYKDEIIFRMKTGHGFIGDEHIVMCLEIRCKFLKFKYKKSINQFADLIKNKLNKNTNKIK